MNAIIVLFGIFALATAQQQFQEQAPLQVQEQQGAAQGFQNGPIPLQGQQGQGPEQRAYVQQVTLGRPTGYVAAPGPVVVQDANAQVLSAVDASRQLIAAAIAQGANPNNFGVQTGAHYTIAQAPNTQNPVVWDALDALRGRQDLTIDEILNILSVAVAGKDYPVYNDIPTTRFSCEKTHQAGFYADIEAQCQVIRRCDINGVEWSYLCPNMTLFNQITLVCDWFFNVNCNNAAAFYDYSNPRLYTQFPLLDTPANYQGGNTRPVQAVGVKVNYQQPTVYRQQ